MTGLGLALILAALTAAGLVYVGRLSAPDRPRRCKCAYCRHGLPDDDPDYPLQGWEWKEVRRMEAFYRKNAHDPTTRRRRWPSRSR